MKLKYMLLALMPLCMASCSEEETIVPVETQREVRVTAGADAQSRIVLSDQGNRKSKVEDTEMTSDWFTWETPSNE